MPSLGLIPRVRYRSTLKDCPDHGRNSEASLKTNHSPASGTKWLLNKNAKVEKYDGYFGEVDCGLVGDLHKVEELAKVSPMGSRT